MFHKVRSFEIQKSRNIKPLLLRNERSQLYRWFGHVSKIPQKRLPKEAFTCQSKWEETNWTTSNQARRQSSVIGGGGRKNVWGAQINFTFIFGREEKKSLHSGRLRGTILAWGAYFSFGEHKQ